MIVDTLKDQENEDFVVDFWKFSYFADFCIFVTQRVKKDRNKSQEIYIALNSNKSAPPENTDQDVRGVKHLLDILYSKIMERFSLIADAFWVFDKNYDG